MNSNNNLYSNQNVFLIGPMGVGKTTIGKMLAKELGLQFIDTDEEVERRAGANIAWIFDVEGEEGFRTRETNVLDDLTQQDGKAILMEPAPNAPSHSSWCKLYSIFGTLLSSSLARPRSSLARALSLSLPPHIHMY